MYVPTVFRLDSREEIARLVGEYNFATLVSCGILGLQATHLPLLFSDQDHPPKIYGHMAKANSQWREFDGRTEAVAIFVGPHHYISPRVYKTTPNVPTWNYAAVHMYGRPVPITDPALTLGHLHELLTKIDPNLENDLPEATDSKYHESMLNGLVAFEMEVQKVEAKAKLNQNKKPTDRVAVYDWLSAQEEPDASQMAELMGRLGLDR
jgi:transcriptional regulator